MFQFLKVLFGSEIVQNLKDLNPGEMSADLLKEKWESVGKNKQSEHEDLV